MTLLSVVRAAQLGVREGVIGDRRTRVTGAAPDAHLAGVLGPDVAAQGRETPGLDIPGLASNLNWPRLLSFLIAISG